MITSSKWASFIFVGSSFVLGDIYLHNPPGSNNRNRERNQNRNNANRMFDSQNNDKGGYPWRGDREIQNVSDPLVYYEGSVLRVEWTNQHACGDDPTTFCSMILQYACEDTMPDLRDGYPSGPLAASDSEFSLYQQATFVRNNGDGTNTITETTQNDTEYGMNENFTWFNDCGKRRRNKGLYTADRILNKNSARSTRQNPNGAQRGFECPEERDYYPYWHPTQWHDIAVFVTDESWCEYYQTHSQNVLERQYCDMQGITPKNSDGMVPIEEQECLQYGGKWKTAPAWNTNPPDCAMHPRSRQNHLGNVGPVDSNGLPLTPYYDWTIPAIPTDMQNATCTFRIRYNISTGDYDSMGGFVSTDTESTSSAVFGSANNCGEVITPQKVPAPSPNNGRSSADSAAASAAEPSPCSNVLTSHNRPLYNRPYVTVFDDQPELSLAINSDQTGRTFQDRSHIFNITKRPAGISSAIPIHNVNVRGRRGNIVQCYPAVEYDFTPVDLTVQKEHYLHFQWSGSDFNQAINPNNGEGWKYSDRHNLVQVDNLNFNVPVKYDEQKMFFKDQATATLFGMQNVVENLASVSMRLAGKNSSCGTFLSGSDNEQNDPTNCGKLNMAPAVFNPGLMQVTQERGTYYFVNTRDNNFSNRAQKWSVTVSGASSAEIFGYIILGIVAGFVVVAALVVAILFKQNGTVSKAGFQALMENTKMGITGFLGIKSKSNTDFSPAKPAKPPKPPKRTKNSNKKRLLNDKSPEYESDRV
jgi:hypothetical protein